MHRGMRSCGTEVESRRFSKEGMRRVINLFSGFLPPATAVAAGLILTPLILSRLGMEAYSYWPLCNSLILYVGLVTTSLGIGLRRHTVSALDRGDLEEAREYFNTGLAMMAILWIILVLAGFLISSRLTSIVEIETELQDDVKRMFLLVTLAVSVGIFGTVFFLGAYARDQIYMEKIAGVISTLLRLLIVCLAFVIWKPSLVVLGFAALAAAAAALIFAMFTFRRYMPEISLNVRKYVTRKKARDLTRFGGWILCAGAGVYLFQSLHLILANRLFGPIEAGRYGVIFQLVTLASANFGHIGYVISRRLISLVSVGDYRASDAILRRYYTWAMCAFALPGGICFVHAELLFTLWLGDHGAMIGNLFRIAMLATFISEPIAIINARLLASKRVITNGISSLLMAPALVALSIALGKGLDWGLAGIAAASGIVILARNLALLIDASWTSQIDIAGIFRGLAVSLLSFSSIAAAVFLRTELIPARDIYGLFLDVALGLSVWGLMVCKLSSDCRDLARHALYRLNEAWQIH
jgi:membrane protein EpsK